MWGVAKNQPGRVLHVAVVCAMPLCTRWGVAHSIIDAPVDASAPHSTRRVAMPASLRSMRTSTSPAGCTTHVRHGQWGTLDMLTLPHKTMPITKKQH